MVLVQQGLCDCIVVSLLHLRNFMGYPICCKFALTQNVVQNAEQFCDILRLPLLSHTQSIGDQHPTGKQGVELYCSPHGVLYGIPAFLELYKPSCSCAIWQHCIATCFNSPWKHSCVLHTTSCHFNFDPEHCSSFANMVSGCSYYPYESQHSTTTVDWQSTVTAGCSNSFYSPCTCPQNWQLLNSQSSCDSSVASIFYPTLVYTTGLYNFFYITFKYAFQQVFIKRDSAVVTHWT